MCLDHPQAIAPPPQSVAKLSSTKPSLVPEPLETASLQYLRSPDRCTSVSSSTDSKSKRCVWGGRGGGCGKFRIQSAHTTTLAFSFVFLCLHRLASPGFVNNPWMFWVLQNNLIIGVGCAGGLSSAWWSMTRYSDAPVPMFCSGSTHRVRWIPPGFGPHLFKSSVGLNIHLESLKMPSFLAQGPLKNPNSAPFPHFLISEIMIGSPETERRGKCDTPTPPGGVRDPCTSFSLYCRPLPASYGLMETPAATGGPRISRTSPGCRGAGGGGSLPTGQVTAHFPSHWPWLQNSCSLQLQRWAKTCPSLPSYPAAPSGSFSGWPVQDDWRQGAAAAFPAQGHSERSCYTFFKCIQLTFEHCQA